MPGIGGTADTDLRRQELDEEDSLCEGFQMPADRRPRGGTYWGRRRKATRERTRGIGGNDRRTSVLYGDYMSGGNVKLHFWVFHFHPFFCSNLESPFFRPDPGVSRERDAQGLSRTAR